MLELAHRFRADPLVSATLVILSLFANILALASPLFVMLVLGRYITYGVDATLYVLCVGMFIALVLEFAFRQLRLRLARGLNVLSEVRTSIGAFGMIVKSGLIEPRATLSEARTRALRNLDSVSTAFTASNLCALLDVPFALLFLFVLFLISPVLGLTATLFVLAVFPLRYLGQKLQKKNVEQLEGLNAQNNRLFHDAIHSPEALRLFDSAGWLINTWSAAAVKLTAFRSHLVQIQGIIDQAIATLQLALGATVIGIGSTLVVSGKMEVGALIGANVLAARALAPISRLAQLTSVFERADSALQNLHTLAEAPIESGTKRPTSSSDGHLEIRTTSFSYPGASSAVFEQLNMKIQKGDVLRVKGANGAGKTTLTRMISGLIQPTKGQVFIDGVELTQLDKNWWREQISVMPQDPQFLSTSIKVNLTSCNPDINEADLQVIIKRSGLSKFIDESASGLEFEITPNGGNLAFGVRKRLAFARTLVRDTQFLILDEPTEGIDEEGRDFVYAEVDRATRARKTIVLISDDPKLIQRVNGVLVLDGVSTTKKDQQNPLPTSVGEPT